MAARSEPGPIVLVVESESDQATWTREVLEADGFRVVLTTDGAQALAVLDVIRPNAVVADMVMPVLDGLAFLRRLRERPEPRAPVVAVSALASYLPEAMALGASVALLKPWDRDRLLGYVRALVGGRPAPRPPVPPPPHDEVRRLRAIHDLNLERPAVGPVLTRFVERVARIFQVPICLVSTVTAEEQYWTASCGLPEDLREHRGTPRNQSFCTHSVASRAPLVVQDARDNPFFRDNRLVTERGLRFYAGVPLFSRGGEALGTLCLLDMNQRPTFGHFDLALLTALSKRVMAELEWRERCTRPDEPSCTFRYLDRFDREFRVLGRQAFAEVLRIQASRLADAGRALALTVLAVPTGLDRDAVHRIEERFDQALLGRLGQDRLGAVIPDATAAEAEQAIGEAAGPDAVVVADRIPGNPEAGEEILRALEASLADQGLAPEVRSCVPEQVFEVGHGAGPA